MNGEDLGPGPRLRLLLENVQNILRPEARGSKPVNKDRRDEIYKNHIVCSVKDELFSME
jgi:hypothetical protein